MEELFTRILESGDKWSENTTQPYITFWSREVSDSSITLKFGLKIPIEETIITKKYDINNKEAFEDFMVTVLGYQQFCAVTSRNDYKKIKE